MWHRFSTPVIAASPFPKRHPITSGPPSPLIHPPVIPACVLGQPTHVNARNGPRHRSLGEICQSISSVKVPIKGFLVSITKSHVSTPLSMCGGAILGGPSVGECSNYVDATDMLVSMRMSSTSYIPCHPASPSPAANSLGNCFVALFLSSCLLVHCFFCSAFLLVTRSLTASFCQ